MGEDVPLNHASAFADLTEAQYAAIGRVMVESSNLEHLVERLLIRLARTPDFLGLTLTNPIGSVRRLDALKTLVDVHRRRYSCHFVESEVLDELQDAARNVDKFRIDRNKFAHYCWCRESDEKVFGIKFTGKQPTLQSPTKDSIVLTLADLNAMATEMRALVRRLQTVLDGLPQETEGNR